MSGSSAFNLTAAKWRRANQSAASRPDAPATKISASHPTTGTTPMHMPPSPLADLARQLSLCGRLRTHRFSGHVQAPPSPRKTTSPPKASPPSSTATTSKTGPAASRRTPAKSPPCRPRARRMGRENERRHPTNIGKSRTANSSATAKTRSSPPRKTTAISKCGSIGRSAQTATAASIFAAFPKSKSGTRPIEQSYSCRRRQRLRRTLEQQEARKDSARPRR